MKQYEEVLEKYILDHAIVATQLHFSASCHTAADAAKAVGAQINEIVKSICLIDATGRLVVAIVKAEDKIDLHKVKETLAIPKPRFATSDEVLAKTGYPVGGVPPFGYDAIFLLDEHVMKEHIVYAGGGSDHAMIKISSKDLQKANTGEIVHIAK